MIGHIAVAAILLFTGPSMLLAQRPSPVGVRIVALNSGYAPSAVDSHLSDQVALSVCAQDRIFGAATGAVLGAGLGWFLYTFTLGALSDSHGAEYKSELRRWMWAGAAVGAVGVALEPSRRPECRA